MVVVRSAATLDSPGLPLRSIATNRSPCEIAPVVVVRPASSATTSCNADPST